MAENSKADAHVLAVLNGGFDTELLLPLLGKLAQVGIRVDALVNNKFCEFAANELVQRLGEHRVKRVDRETLARAFDLAPTAVLVGLPSKVYIDSCKFLRGVPHRPLLIGHGELQPPFPAHFKNKDSNYFGTLAYLDYLLVPEANKDVFTFDSVTLRERVESAVCCSKSSSDSSWACAQHEALRFFSTRSDGGPKTLSVGLPFPSNGYFDGCNRQLRPIPANDGREEAGGHRAAALIAFVGQNHQGNRNAFCKLMRIAADLKERVTYLARNEDDGKGCGDLSGDCQWVKSPQAKLRALHDARVIVTEYSTLAEVSAWCGKQVVFVPSDYRWPPRVFSSDTLALHSVSVVTSDTELRAILLDALKQGQGAKPPLPEVNDCAQLLGVLNARAQSALGHGPATPTVG